MMGEMAEYYRSLEDEFPAHEAGHSPRQYPRHAEWIAADGRHLQFKDMSTSHLINAAAYLWRSTVHDVMDVPGMPRMYINPENAKHKLQELLDEIQRRRA